MNFHAPCGVVLYFVVCKLYTDKEKKEMQKNSLSLRNIALEHYAPEGKQNHVIKCIFEQHRGLPVFPTD